MKHYRNNRSFRLSSDSPVRRKHPRTSFKVSSLLILAVFFIVIFSVEHYMYGSPNNTILDDIYYNDYKSTSYNHLSIYRDNNSIEVTDENAGNDYYYSYSTDKEDYYYYDDDDWMEELSSPTSESADIGEMYGESYRDYDNALSTIQPTASSLPLTHWNVTDRKSPPTVYFCHPNDGNGIGEAKLLMELVLPEYTHKSIKVLPQDLLQRNYTNEYDVFIGIFDMYCAANVERWLHTFYNGHLIYFSGESVALHPVQARDAPKEHAFGPLTDDFIRDEDMLLYYLQLTYLFHFRDVLPPNKMINATERPKGKSFSTSTFMMYANSNCVDFREEAVGLLSNIGQVSCDGRCQGKTPPDGNRTNLVKTNYGTSLRNWWTNINHYSNFRFCIVMEHTADHSGYITEKILMAFVGGCIPIYYGTERIFDIFNSKAFVFYNISETEKSLELVQKLNSDQELYEQMLNEPIVANGEKTIEEYFSFTDDVGNGALKRKIRTKLGLQNLVP